MERELWAIVASHLTVMARRQRPGRFTHPIARVLRVYLWAVLHDRPVSWACDRRYWAGVKPPARLPDQSTMSRRLARPETRAALDDLLDRLSPACRDALVLRIDGKPLAVAKHSVDPHATFGRGAGGFQRGYKLHALYADHNRPVAYRVVPMNVDERVVAAEMLEHEPIGPGYLLADANYETNPLYDHAHGVGRVLITPRRFKHAKGLGGGKESGHSKHRVAMIQRLRDPSPFARDLLATRARVETRFANLTNFGGGLTHLPPWVRNRRVEPYVTAKLVIRLARDHAIEKHKRA